MFISTSLTVNRELQAMKESDSVQHPLAWLRQDNFFSLWIERRQCNRGTDFIKKNLSSVISLIPSSRSHTVNLEQEDSELAELEFCCDIAPSVTSCVLVAEHSDPWVMLHYFIVAVGDSKRHLLLHDLKKLGRFCITCPVVLLKEST